ncbi:hypothetical protein GCM10027071_23940 [Microbacterium marinum]
MAGTGVCKVVRSGRAATWVRSAAAGVVVFATVLAVMLTTGTQATAAEGSAVTVAARDQDTNLAEAPLPDLKVSVSQTRDLISQAVTVSWTGGKPSTAPSGQNGGEDYLQIMQCWGTKTEAGIAGPDRETCQFGGFNSPGASRDLYLEGGAEVATQDREYTYEGESFFDPSYTGIPFRAVTGEEVKRVVDGKVVPGVDLNNNAFFTRYTTNEIPWAGSSQGGSGSVTFEVQTSLASPGLGCGRVLAAGGDPQSCWLVIVPRGAGRNVDSPLFWQHWQHRIAVPLEFQPVGQHCPVGADEFQLAGTELASDAVSSWQPAMCRAASGSVYSLLTITDADAAMQANTTADAPLALTSAAIDTSEGALDNLTYAPVAMTGLSVTFAIDRFPSATADDEAQARARQPFTEMKLTPRLLAKLLTSSYTDALPADADKAHLGKNPRSLLFDPEFRDLNDAEWAKQAIVNPAVADLMVPQGRSAYARALWSYIVADEDARAFLSGTRDPWGMVVNPYASTDARKNPTGAALELPRDDFPKVDPSEAYAGEDRVLNAVSWRPFTSDLAAGAYYALRGDGLTTGDWDPLSIPAKWKRNDRSLVGQRAVLALTDSSASARYDTVTASLRNAAGQFVRPTDDALAAAAAAMVPVESQPQVRVLDHSSTAAVAARSAYPLTLPVYAATNITLNTAPARSAYAAFVRYAIGGGQEPGVQQGQLPPGYAPLPAGWRAQAEAAAALIAAGSRPTPTPTPTPAPTGDPDPVTPPANGGSAGGGADAGGSAAPPAAPVDVAPPAEGEDPSASGAISPELSAGETPGDPETGALGSALPLSALAGALAAAVVPFIRRRRPL